MKNVIVQLILLVILFNLSDETAEIRPEKYETHISASRNLSSPLKIEVSELAKIRRS